MLCYTSIKVINLNKIKNMKHIVTIFLICLLSTIIYTPSLCMKQNTQTSIIPKAPDLRVPKITAPLDLHEFFPVKTEFTTTYNDYKHLRLVKSLPHEIVDTIIHMFAMQTSFTHAQWWYFDKKIKHCLGNTVYAVAFEPSGTTLAVAHEKTIDRIDVATGKKLNSITKQHSIFSLTYNGDGTKIAYGTKRGLVEVISSNLKESHFTHQTTDHLPIWSIAFSPNEHYIAIGSDDKQASNIGLIDIKKNKCHYKQKIMSAVYGILFLSNNRIQCALPENFLLTFNKRKNNLPTTSKLIDADDSLYACAYNNGTYVLGYRLSQAYMVDTFLRKNASLKTSAEIYSLSLHKNILAIGQNNGTIAFFKQYTHPSSEQLLLKAVISLWLLIEKPDKTIDTPEKLLQKISHYKTFTWHIAVSKRNKKAYNTKNQTIWRLNKQQVASVWYTLPEPVRACLWNTIKRIIQTYGK